MPVFKTTLLIQLATGTVAPNPSLRRIGGWSEGFYLNAADFATAISFLNGGANAPASLCELRAGLLPTSAQIVGQRVQQVSPVGRSQSLNRLWSGGSGMDCDIPQMALLTRIPTQTGTHSRQYIIRGIPDQLVIDGEFAPNRDYSRALGRLFGILSSFSLRTVALTGAANTIETVSLTGLVTFTVARPAMIVGDTLEIRNVVVAGGVIVNGSFEVESVSGTNPLVCSVKGWNSGAGVGGQGAVTGTSYPLLDGVNATTGRIIVKKVGRPFVQYRGRASVRRKRRRVA